MLRRPHTDGSTTPRTHEGAPVSIQNPTSPRGQGPAIGCLSVRPDVAQAKAGLELAPHGVEKLRAAGNCYLGDNAPAERAAHAV